MTRRPLVARTEELGVIDDLDLINEAGADGFLHQSDAGGLAGRGVAATIDLPGGIADPTAAARVHDVLHSIETADGSRPVAVGSFPFSPDGPATLVVPAVTVRTDAGGRVRVTTVATGAGATDSWRRQPQAADHHAPDGFALHPEPPHRAFQALLDSALKAIADGELTKVVVARAVRVEANRPIDRAVVLRRLRALYPSCVTFAAGRFVGASPEMLVQRSGTSVRTHPLAGTVPRSGDPEHDRRLADGMLHSAKQRWEHSLTVDAAAAVIRPLCTDLDVPASPSVMSLRNVAHLGSDLRGTLTADESGVVPSALDLAGRLHPTPAVGGVPTEAALAFLRDNEALDRGPYAGAVGWVDREGDGEWTVGIRSALLDGSTALLFSGVGIVEGSDVDAELAETQFKLQALLSAIVRP